ncbi:putative Fur family transcriptional regulator [Gordonia hirsuta DSM 44140 = NBRC 16056]|uniref:Putative Fur family transcriptional regulator n=1 Tax=Gordonia hirsuta DSM 44140 = NBRC 16056 TaxID=1121927 RepID=L7L8B1_9ACTN|nr:Fur family transcriptional regulator [Gordonia hirsuta]GAC57159.1 putative Fur family transcriptional regulator [Gordonia hirsuta DSM 44140 = NBRC 16056]
MTRGKPLTGQRTTRQRAAIADLLTRSDEFLSAQQLHDLLVERGDSIGLTTVYRNLQALVDAGQVDAIWDGSGETRYRHCSDGHHHHLVCRKCGSTVEIQAETVDTWAATVAETHGFQDIAHTVEIFGLCPACAA